MGGIGSDREDESKEFDAPLVVLERNKLLSMASLSMSLGGPLLFAASLVRALPSGLIGLYLTIIGLVLLHQQARHNTNATRRHGRVRVIPEGVQLDGVLVVARDAIADGFFQPRSYTRGRWNEARGKRDYRSSIRLVDKRRRIVFEAEAEEEQARAMLQVLGLDLGRRRAEFPGPSPLHGTQRRQLATMAASLGIALVVGASLAVSISSFSSLLVLGMVPLAVVAAIPSKIIVGLDGILTRWLWMKRFIPMCDVRTVLPEGDSQIRVRLVSGKDEIIDVSTIRKNEGRELARLHRDAVLARISEGLATFRARGPNADVTALVSRGGRPRDEWLEALRKLRRGGVDGGYRAAAVRSDDLLRVVEDPSAPEDARAGAALVLRESLDDDARARVRIAADATASPKLRMALDAALAPAEHEAEEAVGELVLGDGDDARVLVSERLRGDSIQPKARSDISGRR